MGGDIDQADAGRNARGPHAEEVCRQVPVGREELRDPDHHELQAYRDPGQLEAHHVEQRHHAERTARQDGE